jgi:hypothetical protein
MRVVAFFLLLALAACVTREPSPAEIKARRFEPVADKAVIYLFRERVDFRDSPASFSLDGAFQGTNYRASYFRLELAPGLHRLAGFAGDTGYLEFEVEANQLYFIRHSLMRIGSMDRSLFQPVPADYGRQAVLQYELNGAP